MRFEKVIVLDPPSPTGFVSNKDSMDGFGQLFAESAAFRRLPFSLLACPAAH